MITVTVVSLIKLKFLKLEARQEWRLKSDKFTNKKKSSYNDRKKQYMIKYKIQINLNMQYNIYSEFSEYFQ